jgi:hypothetical protein
MTMFIAGEGEEVEVEPSMPIDRSTGAARAGMVALQRHARRVVLLGALTLVAACSQLKLGYDNADLLLAYALDSYLDLDEAQERQARERIAALHRWHRSTQLPAYAQLLAGAQQKVGGTVTAADVRAFRTGIDRSMAALGEQAAPDLARLALTLKPAQVDRLAAKLASDTSKARRELVRFAGPESASQRVDRFVERAEEWFGSVTPAQREMIRAGLERQPGAQEAWMQERELRQRELVEVVTRIRAEQPPAETAAQWLREYFARLAEPREPERRARVAQLREDNAELVAQLINAATPAQRAALARKLRGYAEDFVALAAPAAASGRG